MESTWTCIEVYKDLMKELEVVTHLMRELVGVTLFLKKMKCWVSIMNCKASNEHVEETEEGLENDMSFHSGVDIEQEITNIF